MERPLHLGKYRVQARKGTLEVYRQLKGTVFNEFHHLFSLCVFLGNRKGELFKNKVSREPIFWSDTFKRYEYAAFYSLILEKSEEGDYSMVKDGQKALDLLQDYADSGMQVILESDFMKKYVKKEKGEYILDFGPNDYLAKQFMYFAYSEYMSE